MGEVVKISDILAAVKIIRDYVPANRDPVFFTHGTGIPDEMAIEYFKDTSITVITRDGTEWIHGERKEK